MVRRTYNSSRHASTFLTVLLLASIALDAAAQPARNCLIYEAPDCQGEPVLLANTLDHESCLDWLRSPAYYSVLWDPDGEAICTNNTDLPVELSSFRTTVVGGVVRLEWTTASETDNAGFDIEQRLRSGDFERIGFVAGSGTSREARSYRYDVANLEPNRHIFRLKQIDFDGSSAYSSEVEAMVTVPDRSILESPYPNPFNPTSTVRFAVEVEQYVRVTLTDAMGRQVALLYEGRVPANETRALSIDGSGLSSGPYVVTLTGEGFSESVSVQLTK